jgi:hypothetical protein
VGSKTIEETGHELQARKISHIYHNDCLWRLAFRDPLGAIRLLTDSKQKHLLPKQRSKFPASCRKGVFSHWLRNKLHHSTFEFNMIYLLPIENVARILGHASAETTIDYVVIQQSRIKQMCSIEWF